MLLKCLVWLVGFHSDTFGCRLLSPAMDSAEGGPIADPAGQVGFKSQTNSSRYGRNKQYKTFLFHWDLVCIETVWVSAARGGRRPGGTFPLCHGQSNWLDAKRMQVLVPQQEQQRAQPREQRPTLPLGLTPRTSEVTGGRDETGECGNAQRGRGKRVSS